MCVESMGVTSGSGCKEVYRCPITYPYSSCICSFCRSIHTFCSLKNVFRSFIILSMRVCVFEDYFSLVFDVFISLLLIADCNVYLALTLSPSFFSLPNPRRNLTEILHVLGEHTDMKTELYQTNVKKVRGLSLSSTGYI